MRRGIISAKSKKITLPGHSLPRLTSISVKLNRCFTGFACFLSIIFALSLAAPPQSDGEPEPIVSRALAATVDYGSDKIFQPSKQQTDFNLLGLDPGQTINITVWFPTKLAGQSILADPLDGGTIFVPARGLVVGSDGTVVFQFQAGQGPGSAGAGSDDHRCIRSPPA